MERFVFYWTDPKIFSPKENETSRKWTIPNNCSRLHSDSSSLPKISDPSNLLPQIFLHVVR